MPTHERELRAPVALTDLDGRLAPAALGWSRTPLHACHLPANLATLGRRKRWDYWCVLDDALALAVTVADLDYLGLVTVSVCDLRAGAWTDCAVPLPLGLGLRLPDTVAGLPIRVDLPGFRLALEPDREGTAIRVAARSPTGARIEADVHVALPLGHESLNVVVPWSQRRFQFTSKHVARPARGSVRWRARRGEDLREHGFGSQRAAYGCLDFGRGLWPQRTHWNWGAAAGEVGGAVLGLQLGGRWTDGTGATENAILLDGRVTKIGEELAWAYDPSSERAPWQIRTRTSDAIDLTFTPLTRRRVAFSLGVLASELVHCFGHYAGTVCAETRGGERVRLVVPPLLGWAEDHRARW